MEKKLANLEDAIAKFSSNKEIYIDISGSQNNDSIEEEDESIYSHYGDTRKR